MKSGVHHCHLAKSRMVTLDEDVPCLHLWMIDGLLDRVDAITGNPRLVKDRHDLIDGGKASHPLLDNRIDEVAVLVAMIKIVEPSVLDHVFATHRLGEWRPHGLVAAHDDDPSILAFEKSPRHKGQVAKATPAHAHLAATRQELLDCEILALKGCFEQ